MSKHESNPANETAFRVTEDNRIPLGMPETTLELPKIEGYVCYWFLDSPGRIMRAVKAGWEFINRDEVQLNQHGVANSMLEDGNSDLGDRVSVYGAQSEHGKTQMLYAMKIREDWYKADEARKLGRVAQVVEAIRGHVVGAGNESAEDGANYRYDPFGGQRKTIGGLKF